MSIDPLTVTLDLENPRSPCLEWKTTMFFQTTMFFFMYIVYSWKLKHLVGPRCVANFLVLCISSRGTSNNKPLLGMMFTSVYSFKPALTSLCTRVSNTNMECLEDFRNPESIWILKYLDTCQKVTFCASSLISKKQ